MNNHTATVIRTAIAVLIAFTSGAALTAAVYSTDTDSTPVAATTCTTVDGDTLAALIADGVSVDFDRAVPTYDYGTWTVAGEIVGSAATEDEGFTACGSSAVITLIASA